MGEKKIDYKEKYFKSIELARFALTLILALFVMSLADLKSAIRLILGFVIMLWMYMPKNTMRD